MTPFSALALAAALAAPTPAKSPADITWKKTVLDAKFRGEGVSVADVNKDGKLDVLAGEWWYEAPDWKPHEMQKPGNYGDGLNGYSRVFACWAEDLNADGYPDLIVVDFPGKPAYWMENPKGDAGKHWAKHEIWHSACNETPIYVDLFGTGKRVLVMGFQPKGEKEDGNLGQMAYFTPNPKDPTAVWEMHPISEPSVKPEMKDGKPVGGKVIPGTNRFSHGLGVGDLNGDKKLDVITAGGWWEQPSTVDGKTAWKFHPGGVTDATADLFAFDVDNDGKADILGTSAHKFGIWWHKQLAPTKDGHPEWKKSEIFKELVSETHAAHFVDIDGDGQADLVTGKRWWSHGRSEPGSNVSPHIYWLKVTREPDGMAKFTPYVIDSDSGIGTQFVVADMNGDGLLDVVSSNKKGVRVIVQERK
ncbi:MAG: VCBS repeat-containing protein [Fimbriiglobus sp.]|jgi:hypothetical protein|nr:VCBS repeat-containing protein [Fimbriiglobus sp.]